MPILVTKQMLQHDYQWTNPPPALGWSTVAMRRKDFDESDGHQMLNLLQFTVNALEIRHQDGVQRLETLIKEDRPHNQDLLIEVFHWLVAQY